MCVCVSALPKNCESLYIGIQIAVYVNTVCKVLFSLTQTHLAAPESYYFIQDSLSLGPLINTTSDI
jgi:hypothetical protein